MKYILLYQCGRVNAIRFPDEVAHSQVVPLEYTFICGAGFYNPTTFKTSGEAESMKERKIPVDCISHPFDAYWIRLSIRSVGIYPFETANKYWNWKQKRFENRVKNGINR